MLTYMPCQNGRRPFFWADRYPGGTRPRLRVSHHHAITRERRRGFQAEREGQPVRFGGEVSEATQKPPVAFSEKARVRESRRRNAAQEWPWRWLIHATAICEFSCSVIEPIAMLTAVWLLSSKSPKSLDSGSPGCTLALHFCAIEIHWFINSEW